MFIHIPKCGGTSIEHAFRRAGCAEALRTWRTNRFSRVNLQHMHSDLYRIVVRKGFADYRFAVVRNPFDRLASEYRMKMHEVPSETRAHADDWINATLKGYARKPTTRDNHIRPQVDFLDEDVDVFRLEDGLQNAVRRAFEVLNAPLPTLEVKRRSPVALKPIITSRTVDAIRAVYAEDFTRLGYDADNPASAFQIDDSI